MAFFLEVGDKLSLGLFLFEKYIRFNTFFTPLFESLMPQCSSLVTFSEEQKYCSDKNADS